MEWIKVLNKHVLFEYNDLRDSEFVAWIKIMALTAELEHEPTRQQILNHVNYQTLDSLSEKLHNHSIDLPSILHKVLIDASYVSHRREVWKNNKKQYRQVNKNVSMDVSMDVSNKEIDKEIDKENIPPTPKKDLPKIQLIENHFQTIPDALMEKWREVAPGINIPDEIKKAELWLLAHPEKRRSRYGAFLSNWMVRAQEHFIKYGGNGNGIRTNRSDPRDKNLQSREDAECAAITARWEASKKAPPDKTRGASGNDDAPDFNGVSPG
jgi:hypothetical protein